MVPKAPWLAVYGTVPATLTYPDVSMAALLQRAAQQYPTVRAYEFLGSRVSYAAFWREVERCARALTALGVRRGEAVTICMPNTPQALVMFYAVNAVGAVAAMIHPLSSEQEIAFFVNTAKSRVALILDRLYPRFAAMKEQTPLEILIVTGIGDGMKPPAKWGYAVTEGRKVPKIPKGEEVVLWKPFLRLSEEVRAFSLAPMRGDDTAVILFSGGTTGVSKGVALTNLNFNALALQTAAAGDCVVPGHRMLAVMPLFHGFGLGVCVHTVLLHGVTCVLVPRFSAATYAKLLKKSRPHYIAGVPTLFEALLRDPHMNGVDLARLEGVFCGGDSLSAELKHRVDAFLKEHGAQVQVREGYGTTECVTASCLTPKETYREGSIGVPFPDMYYKIVVPETEEPCEDGTVGEICISGPTVMRGYVDNEAETARVLRRHADGRVWLHTGDVGYMDSEGFVYFRQRLKRVIITSGYNVYPSQIERVLNTHPAVQTCAVIGVPDAYRGQRVKAFVVLNEGVEANASTEASLRAHCEKGVARYAMPAAFVFRKALPTTRVGKVAYAELEREEN